MPIFASCSEGILCCSTSCLFIGTVATVCLAIVQPVRVADLVLFAGMWLVTGLGLTVGYHRLFTHRAFATGRVVSVALVIMGSTAGRGSMLSWTATHASPPSRTLRS